MTTFTFTTRQEYFQYKANWKEQYLTLSKDIRKSAIERREAERAFSKSSPSYPSYGQPEKLTIYFAATRGQCESRRKHQDLKAKATALLQERWESKVAAGIQMQINNTIEEHQPLCV